MDDKHSRVGLGLTFFQDEFQSKKECKGQESIRSNNTIKPGLDIGSDKTTSKYHIKRAKRLARSQQVTIRLQGTDKTV